MSKQLRLPTLLVISDNPSIRFWIKKHLDDEFFIITAEREQEAISALNAKIDFIIVDANFEGCDAIELCEKLSKETRKNLIPILLITGRLKKSYRDKATRAGVTHFLSDQLDLDELKTRIAQGFKSASVRQKTEDLGKSLKMPKITTNGSLKKKFILNEQAIQLLAAAKEKNLPTALLLLRIDLQEQLNKNDLLTHLSDYINTLLREKDILLPAPDDGLIVLLSNTPIDAANMVAKKLQHKIHEQLFVTKEGKTHLTVSIAVSSIEASEKSFNTMLDSAAKSLKAHSETNLIISTDQESS
ncbi:MAG: hypothetical protein COT85_00850 [Chlamydiae bacterium CG10_big_fil_rev_8_21_14_0_10_42_34]|nr:MAG: hypothetical protein COT85_00850 [Chlamydiae bacterium CG10_big_fil_rev_8_21_14_0_10_42_34]